VTDRWAQAEAERVQGNLIRVGRVTEVDAANGLAKLTVGGLETDWLPWGVHRAGGTRTASAPTVGEQRLLFSPYGDMAQGVIGQAIYQDDHPTPATTGDQEVTVYPDGTRVEYDAAANKLQIDVAGNALVVINCKQATVKADTSVTLDTPETICTGNLTVAKSLTTGAGGGSATINGAVHFVGPSVQHNSKSIGDTHTHTGVQTGGGTTGAPT